MTTEDAQQELIRQALDALNATRDFIAAEAPPLLREMVTWGIISNALIAVGALVILYLSMRTGRRCIVAFKADRSDEEILWGLAAAGCYGVALIAALCAIASMIDAAQALIVPRVYLVEHLARLAVQHR